MQEFNLERFIGKVITSCQTLEQYDHCRAWIERLELSPFVRHRLLLLSDSRGYDIIRERTLSV